MRSLGLVALGLAALTIVGAVTPPALAANGHLVRQGAVYSSAQSGSQSFLRFVNTSTAAGVVRVSLSDSATGQSLGQWTSPGIPAGSAQQYAIATLEGALASGVTKPAFYTVAVDSDFGGFFQHVLWRSSDGTLTNLSTCAAGVSAGSRQVSNVHSSIFDTGYPSSVVVANTSYLAAPAALGVYDAATGAKLSTYATAAIPGNGQVTLQVTAIETAAGIMPSSAVAHYIIRSEGEFAGYLQHLVNNKSSGVITDMTTACALDGAAMPETKYHLRTAAVYSSTQAGSQSHLRFYNTSSKTGTITVVLTNAITGQTLSQWTSPDIAPGAAPQFSLAAIEAGAELPINKADYYAIRVKSELAGSFQHILYRPSANTLTNLSTCDSGIMANPAALSSVHSSVLDAAYPSSVVVNNTGTAAASVALGVYDAADGRKLGTYTTGVIPSGGQVIVGVAAMEAAMNVTPGATQYHYVIKAEGAFTGFLQHLVNNKVSGVITDMTTTCKVPGLPDGAPITITAGGTYSGTYVSLDRAVPAVRIRTTQPVVLENCAIYGRGALIDAYNGIEGARVTVRNCRALALDPQMAGARRGRFLHGFKMESVVAENNYVEAAFSGVSPSAPDGFSPSGPVRIRYNVFNNLDTAPTDGRGSRKPVGLGPDTYVPEENLYGSHAVGLSGMQRLADGEIAWNEIISEPGLAFPGDNIDIHKAGGTSTVPVTVHDNYIQGGYHANPKNALYYNGAITLDGSGGDTAETATQFVKIFNNQIVAHSNFGIYLAAGHNNEAYGNRVVATGRFPDGDQYSGYAGVWVENCACFNQPASVYFGNFARDNVAGMYFPYTDNNPPPKFTGSGRWQSFLLPGCDGGASGAFSKCVNNVALEPVTAAMELNETTLWREKVRAASVRIGPQPF